MAIGADQEPSDDLAGHVVAHSIASYHSPLYLYRVSIHSSYEI